MFSQSRRSSYQTCSCVFNIGRDDLKLWQKGESLGEMRNFSQNWLSLHWRNTLWRSNNRVLHLSNSIASNLVCFYDLGQTAFREMSKNLTYSALEGEPFEVNRLVERVTFIICNLDRWGGATVSQHSDSNLGISKSVQFFCTLIGEERLAYHRSNNAEAIFTPEVKVKTRKGNLERDWC